MSKSSFNASELEYNFQAQPIEQSEKIGPDTINHQLVSSDGSVTVTFREGKDFSNKVIEVSRLGKATEIFYYCNDRGDITVNTHNCKIDTKLLLRQACDKVFNDEFFPRNVLINYI